MISDITIPELQWEKPEKSLSNRVSVQVHSGYEDPVTQTVFNKIHIASTGPTMVTSPTAFLNIAAGDL